MRLGADETCVVGRRYNKSLDRSAFSRLVIRKTRMPASLSPRPVNSNVMFLTPAKLRRLLLNVIIYGGCLISVQPAFACLCNGASQSKLFNRARKRAAVIFVGRAVDVHNGITNGEFPGWRVTLRVDRFWKGRVAEEMIVFTGPGNCASYFEVGGQYLVFAYVSSGENHLYTDVCMQTGALRYEAYNLKRLGTGKTLNASQSRAKHNKSLDASGGSVFLNLIRPAMLD